MAGLDWVIIGSYFTLLLAVAWCDERRRSRPLRTPRLVPARPRLGLRPILFSRPRVHHARVFGPTLFTNRALGAVRHHSGGARIYEVRRLDLRRRYRVRDAAAGSRAAGGRRHIQQLLYRLRRRSVADRPLYGAGRDAGGGV